MLNDLDDTLAAILNDADAPDHLENADVSFETPDRNYAPGQSTVNLFLYEVQENRQLRDPEPVLERVGDQFVRRPPPLRVDCSYLVTAWSNEAAAARTVAEHRLLSLSLLWLSRFPTIPAGFLQGGLANQPFPPPTLVAQMDGNKNAGEFWSALGQAPRPSFNLIVTIAMTLDTPFPEGPPVVTKEIRVKAVVPRDDAAPVLATVFEIAGIVTNANTQDVLSDAQVTLVELGRTSLTDEAGRFRFGNLSAGNYTLRAVKVGFTQLDKPIAVPGTVLNEYDVGLTP